MDLCLRLQPEAPPLSVVQKPLPPAMLALPRAQCGPGLWSTGRQAACGRKTCSLRAAAGGAGRRNPPGGQQPPRELLQQVPAPAVEGSAAPQTQACLPICSVVCAIPWDNHFSGQQRPGWHAISCRPQCPLLVGCP